MIRTSLHTVAVAACAAFLLASPVPGQAQDGIFQESEGMASVGSRRGMRSVADSPTPVTVIHPRDLTEAGVSDMSDLLRTVVPAWNVHARPHSDASTFVRPPNLRGFTSDQSLVLLNGKRRHRGAHIGFEAGGGIQGPDVSTIPAIALKRVEVLKDSASAQYGSDAIAGVVNFVLKDAPQGGVVEAQWGQTYEGDGDEYRISANAGVPMGGAGFLNVSAEFREADSTVRSVQQADAQALIDTGNANVRQPYVERWGRAETSGDYKLFANFGLDAGLYAFGNHAQREVEGDFLWRDESIHPARYPGGYTPRFKGEVTDTAGTVGFRNELGSGLGYDFSLTYGQHEVDHSISDSVDASDATATSPTAFDLGAYVQTEYTANADLTYPLDVELFHSPLNIAVGFEWREEEFEVTQGEPGSENADGFPGFDAEDAGSWDRSNVALYLDMESDVRDDLTVSTAVRWEDHEDIGTEAGFKLAALKRMNNWLNVRGSVNTGFRVPTVGQANVRKVSATGNAQVTRLPSTDPLSRLFGGKVLEPEESISYSAGFVINLPHGGVTFDIYHIEVEDRITTIEVNCDDYVGPGNAPCTAGANANDPAIIDALGVSSFQYFGNGFDTETRGIDIVSTLDLTGRFLASEQGETDFTFAFNYTKTEVTKQRPGFPQSFEVVAHEQGLPRYRFQGTLRHDRESWRALARLNHFGPFTVNDFSNEGAGGFPDEYKAGSEYTVDVEGGVRIGNGMEVVVGATNLFDDFPDEVPNRRISGSRYPGNSPGGLDGGFYYARVQYAW